MTTGGAPNVQMPRWLRPAAVLLVVVAHAAVLMGFAHYRASPPPALETVDLDLIPEGDLAPETTRAASAPSAPEQIPDDQKKPDRATPEMPTPKITEADNHSPPLDTPPQQPAPDALVLPASSTENKPPEPHLTDKPAEKPKPQPAQRLAKASPADAPVASTASEAHKVGIQGGRAADSGMSAASYGAILLAQIQAHKFYPESARARGIAGSVRVAFSVGARGGINSVSIVSSSGSSELDGAARQIVRSVAAPPPPGGTFSASTTIVFSGR
jgi:periplasmic protein TonB